MSKDNLKKKLEELILEKKSLSYLFEKEFNSDDEFNNFKTVHQADFDKYKKIVNEIEDLEWQLMSEKERLEYLEEQKNIKEKYSDE